jgi:hypothetical protein
LIRNKNLKNQSRNRHPDRKWLEMYDPRQYRAGHAAFPCDQLGRQIKAPI